MIRLEYALNFLEHKLLIFEKEGMEFVRKRNSALNTEMNAGSIRQLTENNTKLN